MATWVLSECGLRPLKPLPKINCPRPRTGLLSKTSIPSSFRPIAVCKANNFGFSLSSSSGVRGQSWKLNVSAPLRVSTVGEEDKDKDKDKDRRVINGGGEGVEDELSSTLVCRLHLNWLI